MPSASVPPPSEFLALLEVVTNPTEYKSRVENLLRTKDVTDSAIHQLQALKTEVEAKESELNERDKMYKELGDRLRARSDGLETEKSTLAQLREQMEKDKAKWSSERDEKVKELSERERGLSEKEDHLRAREEQLSSREGELLAREEEHKESEKKLEGRWKAYEEAEVAARNRRADVARLAQEFGKQVSEVTR